MDADDRPARQEVEERDHERGDVTKALRDIGVADDGLAPDVRGALPVALEGCTVLVLGCGSGRVCDAASKLVGPHGRVIGLDTCERLLRNATDHQQWHTVIHQYKCGDVELVCGAVEDLGAAGIQDESVDVVISNCALTRCRDKQQVLHEAFRVLKQGGELHLTDVFCDRRLPPHARDDGSTLLLQGLGGAMYIEDFRRALLEVGCKDYRVVASQAVEMEDEEMAAKVRAARFDVVTVRAFKLLIEDMCEDYGQVAYYLGTLPGHPTAYALDDHHLLEKNRPLLVCSNTAAMLQHTRLSKHFRVDGDLTSHYGLFPCG